MINFTSLTKNVHKTKASKVSLKVILLFALSVEVVSSLTFLKFCNIEPNSCKFHGICKEEFKSIPNGRGQYENYRIHSCKCDNIDCRVPPVKFKADLMCDNYHPLKEFHSHCKAAKDSCFDQVDYRPTKSQCKNRNERPSHHCPRNCLNGHPKSDDFGNCYCQCWRGYYGKRCYKNILTGKRATIF